MKGTSATEKLFGVVVGVPGGGAHMPDLCLGQKMDNISGQIKKKMGVTLWVWDEKALVFGIFLYEGRAYITLHLIGFLGNARPKDHHEILGAVSL